jgi:hypothetical protein
VELATETALHRRALERVDEQHEQLRLLKERRLRFLTLARGSEEPSAPTRPEAPRPRFERETRGLGLER